MSALGSLVRVHTWALNEKRQTLSGLEALGEKLRNDLEGLEAELRQEQSAATASIEGTIAFPAFVAAALERRKRLRVSIANLDLAIEAAREEVREAYQEVKKYELARDNHEHRERDRIALRERKALDELAGTLHRRKKMSQADGES
jgi:flagellar export protein FliJ